MEANKIMNADFLDILFEGRNMSYGAYTLRKTYNKRLTKAIALMFAICLAVLAGAFAAKKIHDAKPKKLIVQDMSLADLNPPEKKVEPPPPPPPPKELPKVEITKITTPKIVADKDVKPEEELPDQEILVNTRIGSFNQKGINVDVINAPVEKGTGKAITIKSNTKNFDSEFVSVQVEAQFPGGQDAWKKFLERNLNSQVPADNGAPSGNYTVTVSFLVDKNGNISQVKALNDPGYGCADEAVRVIKKGPNWISAIQNGRNVIYRQKQNITFQVTE